MSRDVFIGDDFTFLYYSHNDVGEPEEATVTVKVIRLSDSCWWDFDSEGWLADPVQATAAMDAVTGATGLYEYVFPTTRFSAPDTMVAIITKVGGDAVLETVQVRPADVQPMTWAFLDTALGRLTMTAALFDRTTGLWIVPDSCTFRVKDQTGEVYLGPYTETDIEIELVTLTETNPGLVDNTGYILEAALGYKGFDYVSATHFIVAAVT